jgi:hypothetical protein
MNLYPTADNKREMGESVLRSGIGVAGMEWLESAAAQDAGTLDEYRAAVKAWEAAKPRARDFVPAKVRRALVEREAAELERARSEVERIWGPHLK